jgi:hypothetical protein
MKYRITLRVSKFACYPIILTTRFIVHTIYSRILKLLLDFSSNAYAEGLNRKTEGTDCRYLYWVGSERHECRYFVRKITEQPHRVCDNLKNGHANS